ncbi:hypothetical protein [Chromobacterium paludis]|nr:hypothetical protein [Chromobacterium paludis]
MIVSPVEHWDLENLLDAIDDPMPVLSFAEIEASALTAKATH